MQVATKKKVIPDIDNILFPRIVSDVRDTLGVPECPRPPPAPTAIKASHHSSDSRPDGLALLLLVGVSRQQLLRSESYLEVQVVERDLAASVVLTSTSTSLEAPSWMLTASFLAWSVPSLRNEAFRY